MSGTTTTYYEIPLVAAPQRLRVNLLGVTYTMTFVYRRTPDGDGGWILDIGDATNNPLVCGIPLVTGTDLLGQYRHLGIGGALLVGSDGIPDAVPGFDDLGQTSHLYFLPYT